MVTAAGSHFRNIAVDPAANLGIVEINPTGDAWRIAWGFKNGGGPTSEFVSHFMIHAIRKVVSAGLDRVVYHSHPMNLIALTAVLPLDAQTFSRAIWGSLTEAVLMVPEGVGVGAWMPPGSVELAEMTGKLMEKHPAVVWPHHGLLCAGESLDKALGLTHAIEKAAGVYLRALSAGKSVNDLKMASDENIRTAAAAFGVPLNEDYLA